MLGIAVVVVAIWLRRIAALPALALIALLWAGLYFSYSQSSLAALFAAVLAIGAIAGSRGVRKAVAAAAAVLLLVGSALVVNEALDTSVRRATSDRSRRVELTARVLRRPSDCRRRHRLTATCEPAAVGALRTEAQLRLARDAGDRRCGARRDRTPRLRRAARRRRTPDRGRPTAQDAALGLTLAATLLALFVHALFYSGFFEDPITWLVLAIAAGYLVSRDQAAEQVATIAPSPEPALT